MYRYKIVLQARTSGSQGSYWRHVIWMDAPSFPSTEEVIKFANAQKLEVHQIHDIVLAERKPA